MFVSVLMKNLQTIAIFSITIKLKQQFRKAIAGTSVSFYGRIIGTTFVFALHPGNVYWRIYDTAVGVPSV